MPQLDNYNEASPIQLINGIVTTERSGLGPWGKDSQKGFYEFCLWIGRRLSRPSTIVEIGCYAGESTKSFALIGDNIIAVDPWINGYDDNDLSSYCINMNTVEHSFDVRTLNISNITKVVDTSINYCARTQNNSVDLVYLDAIHKLIHSRNDILRWIPKIKPGGYISGHDFCGYWGEVVDAVLETVGLPDVRFKDGSWAKQIN